MAESVPCPNCEARLDLPVLPIGQPVQCPRCRHVFEPKPLIAPLSRLRAVEVAGQAIEAVSLPLPQPLGGAWYAPATMVTLSVFLLSCCLQVYVHFEHFQLEQRWNSEQLAGGRIFVANPVGEADWAKAHSNHAVADVVSFVVFLPASVFFVLWLRQTSSNAKTLCAEGLHYGPATIVAFLIPIINLAWPYFMIQEIWRASNPQAVRGPRSWMDGPYSMSIRLWWACYLVGMFLALIYPLVALFRFGWDSLTLCLINGCIVVWIALLVYIIYDIRARQNARCDRLIDKFNA